MLRLGLCIALLALLVLPLVGCEFIAQAMLDDIFDDDSPPTVESEPPDDGGTNLPLDATDAKTHHATIREGDDR